MSKKHLILLLSCFCFATEAYAESLTTTTPATQPTIPGAAAQTAQVLSQGLLVETFLTSNWKKDDLSKLLGNSLSSFDDYEAYAAGIKIRWDENNKAYGILVNATYPGEIVKGLTTKTTKKDVTKLLGSPQFVDQSNELVGYQYDGYYLFVTFTQEKIKGISIYRRDQTSDAAALIDMAKNLQAYGEKLSSPSTANSFSIFGVWGAPDFTHHLHGIGTFAWEYPSLGIAYDGLEADATLTIYNNFSAKQELSAIKNAKNVVFSKENSLLLEEQNRLFWEKVMIQTAKEQGISSPDKQTIALIDSDGLYSSANIRFYRADYTPLSQLYPGYFVDEVTWLDNNWVLYTTMEGSGVFNKATNEHIVILSPKKIPEGLTDFYDVNAVRVDVKNKTIWFDLSSEKQKPYKLTYQISGNQIKFSK
ncbi:hypothetical protein [uncultured Brevibacillus sp.]|uniref:hypothetical protein n=1 Tax=uncultured Brevibacillus sp. TaxID=169970 RepID=UPI002598D2F7|nr:hypothetical protein [uncultured Brevibacillus sp.]